MEKLPIVLIKLKESISNPHAWYNKNVGKVVQAIIPVDELDYVVYTSNNPHLTDIESHWSTVGVAKEDAELVDLVGWVHI